MSIPNLPVNFKDDILAASNPKRKYQQTFNSDGSVSLEDVTVYTQQGSDFGASQVNRTNGAINNIYNERILDLDELELVTEPGFFVDALAVKELNDNSYKLYSGILGGISSRTYTLKKYNDGTFELCGNLDVSDVRLQYSSSSKVYFTTISAPIPEELTIDLDKRVQFAGSAESLGIYFLSLNELTATTLTAYISAMNYTSEIAYIASGFVLKGWWK